MSDEELKYKIVILSYYDSGKTNIINIYISNEYDENTYRTISSSFSEKYVTLNNRKEIKIELWDTISGERYRSINKIFVRGAKGIIFLYDISYRESFYGAKDYFNYMKDILPNDVVYALVGNKLDIDYEYNSYRYRQITTEEGQRFANENNLLFFEVSAKNGTNIDTFFNDLIRRIYENDPDTENERRIINENKNRIGLRNNRTPKRGCLK